MHQTYPHVAQGSCKSRGRDLAVVLGLMVLLTVVAVSFRGYAQAASLTPTPSTSFPFVVITTPTSGDTNVAELGEMIQTSVVDPNSPVTQVSLYDGTTLVATDTSAPYNFQNTLSTWSSHTLTAVATDAKGAMGTSLPVVLPALALPTSVSYIGQAQWITPTDSATFTAPATIAMSVTIPALVGSIGHFTTDIGSVDFYSGTTIVGTDTFHDFTPIPNGEAANFTWTNVSAGTYVLVAVEHSASNGGGSTTAPILITVTGTTTGTPTSGVTITPTSTSGAKCALSYVITSQWSGGFGASVTITNTGTTMINGWSLVWTFANSQTITQIWNASYTASSGTITATNLSYNGTIAPNASVNFGFNGAWSGSNTKPASFTLNGQLCSS